MTARFFRFMAIVLYGCSLLAATAQAQPAKPAPYPTKPVRWIVPFPPGGATDLLGRFVAQRLSETWGQPVVIENRAGASGTIGSDLVAKAAPDGHIFVVGTTSSHAVSPALNPNIPYDNLRDFTPVALIATFPNVLVVHPSGPKTLQELLAQLKASPGRLSYGSSGNGSSTHLTGELFQQATGTQMVHVPYKGTGPLLNDLMAGHVPLGFDQITAVLPFTQSGRLRALGVASLERSSVAPDVPAIAEVVPGFEAVAWMGLLGPAGVPAEVVAKINADIRRVLQSPEGQQKLRELGATPGALAPPAFGEFVRKDTEKWRALVKSASIKAD
ncbi:MAG: tripartite tricarboxylate transporter substrate binding protein [Proteobacteria bacterium]|nr:tripartite tricarboxylate transporter substrate binding protein [Pseudomonadota bacterium]